MKNREFMVQNEFAVLKHLSMCHRNILTLLDCFDTTNNSKFLKIYEFHLSYTYMLTMLLLNSLSCN